MVDGIGPELGRIFALFSDERPVSARTVETSREDDDFRNAVIVETAEGNRYVLKLAANDFTSPDRIRVWKRTVEEYRGLGYYCPLIYSDRNGGFPTVAYKGRDCTAYVEEYSKYKPIEDRSTGEKDDRCVDHDAVFREVWTMTAKVAAKRFDYSDHPSAYCLFETFCPSDKTDEVMENALNWKEYAMSLPAEHAAQIQRIWKLWNDNRTALEPKYKRLPTSVFQADLNPTNLLIDENGNFAGVYDFNLCGRDNFINYLMRENFDDFEKEVESIRKALRIASGYYSFSREEIEAALPIFRCVKPLWFIRTEELEKAGEDREAIKRCLDRTEYYLTEEIDFKSYMA